MDLVYIDAGKPPPESSCSKDFWRRSMEGFRGGPVSSFAFFTNPKWSTFSWYFQ